MKRNLLNILICIAALAFVVFQIGRYYSESHPIMQAEDDKKLMAKVSEEPLTRYTDPKSKNPFIKSEMGVVIEGPISLRADGYNTGLGVARVKINSELYRRSIARIVGVVISLDENVKVGDEVTVYNDAWVWRSYGNYIDFRFALKK